jgi:hypothetical protein
MPSVTYLVGPPLGSFPCCSWKLESEKCLDLGERGRNIVGRIGTEPFIKWIVFAHIFPRSLLLAFFSGGFMLPNTSCSRSFHTISMVSLTTEAFSGAPVRKTQIPCLLYATARLFFVLAFIAATLLLDGARHVSTGRDGHDARPSIANLVNVELLLVQRRIRFYDDGLLRELFHLAQQLRVVHLQRFRNLWIHSQHHVAVLQMA